MTMVLTRVDEIYRRERFMVEVKTLNGNVVSPKANGLLGPYGRHRKLKDSKTVKAWTTEVFEPLYLGYTCDVLMGNGVVATPQKLLRTVRASY